MARLILVFASGWLLRSGKFVSDYGESRDRWMVWCFGALGVGCLLGAAVLRGC